MIQFDPASFKDPAGRVFYPEDSENWVGRTLSPEARQHLVAAESADLLRILAADHLIVEGEIHDASALGLAASNVGPFVLKQRRVPVVSYAYEWSFEMLRDAALATLAVMDRALERGFLLKDANSFNILFDGAVPKLVDLPSIEPYVDGRPWAGYGQFCRSFVAPLLLASYRDVDIQSFLRGTLGEIPLGTAALMFTRQDCLRSGVLKHVVLPARLERAFGKSSQSVKRETAGTVYPKALLVANVRSLRKLIEGLKAPSGKTEWSSYDGECNYSPADREAKEAFITRALAGRRRRRLVDLGCNSGAYSLLALRTTDHVIGIDLDTKAIDRFYRNSKGRTDLHPVVGNLLNPTPAMGWNLKERRSLLERITADGFLALALIHHLRITGGVPLESIVRSLFQLAPEGIIEWVDKTDTQVQAMLALRPDVYDDFSWTTFAALIRESAELVSVQDTHEGRRRLCHVRAIHAA